MVMASLQIKNNVLHLSGLLNVDTVTEYYESGLEAIEQHQGLRIDLSDADIQGSAGIALLIAWQRKSLQLAKPLAIENAPEHFLAMAKMSGVLDILPFSTESS